MRTPDLVTKTLIALPWVALLVVQPVAHSQASTPTAATAPASSTKLTQQDLDQLLAPIALYPDALIAQMLMAATYPLEVVEATRWKLSNPTLKDKALEDALQKQSWDPSVKGLVAVPQVLQQMNDNLTWMQKLGDAFLADEKAVLVTVQSLRAKAKAEGNLKSSPEQTVRTETQENQTVYIIESAKPEVIYVPTYDPYTVYGSWWYSYPPYYMYPPGYVYPPGLAFATGIIIGAAIWGNCNWGGGNVNVNINHYNNFNRTNISNGNWNHNVDHRKGVAYRDQNVADKYNRGSDRQSAQNREQFRGRTDQGRAEVGSMDRPGAQDRAGDRPSAQDRGADRGGATGGNLDRGSSSSRGGDGGFSGVGSGASTRQASSWGGASRGSMRGGGGGRRR